MQTKGHRFEERWLKPSQIRVDSYQRSEKARLERRVKKILDHWDYDLVNMPKVSQRMDGTYYAFDGQATLAAWQQHEHDAPIKCKVFIGLSNSEEAHLFERQFGESSAVTIQEKINAKLYAGDPEATDMIQSAKDAGIIVNLKDSTKRKNTCCAVSALMHGYKKLGKWQFTEAISVLKEAFDGSPDSLSQQFIKGIVNFYLMYSGLFDKKYLIDVLSKNPTSYYGRYVKDRQGMGDSGTLYAQAFRDTYNKKRKNNKLPVR